MKHVLVGLSFLLALPVFSQKEVFFSGVKPDSVSVVSLQGIFAGPAISHGGSGVTFDAGYFQEKRMTNSTSLLLGGNLFFGRYVKSFIDPGYMDDQHFIAPTIDYGYGFGLSAFAEPRWYFNYKNRYLKGRNVKLNSGWFLGLPLELNTNTLFADSSNLKLNLQLTPVLGYRTAFSRNFFMEASMGMGFELFQLPSVYMIPHMRIKAAYTINVKK